MYDVTTGPKPSDVAPAPIPIEPPRDSDVPPAPSFVVGASDLDATAVRLSALTFADAMNTVTLNGALWNFYYVDSADTTWLLGAALAVGANSLQLSATPTGLNRGDYLQIGTELLLCGTIAGNIVQVTRNALGSPTATQTQPQWTLVTRIRKVTIHTQLPPDFTRTADAASWGVVQTLPGARVSPSPASLPTPTVTRPRASSASPATRSSAW